MELDPVSLGLLPGCSNGNGVGKEEEAASHSSSIYDLYAVLVHSGSAVEYFSYMRDLHPPTSNPPLNTIDDEPATGY